MKFLDKIFQCFHETPKMSCGYTVVPIKKIFIMRGIPGSGKSFQANIIKSKTNGVICSADNFKELYDNFNVENLGAAHKWCMEQFTEYIKAKEPVIIVDNTNTTNREMRPYIRQGIDNGYQIIFSTPPQREENGEKLYNDDGTWNLEFLRGKSVHNVPEDVLLKMINRYNYNVSISDFKNE